jgi:hypothetical protein
LENHIVAALGTLNARSAARVAEITVREAKVII